MKHVTILIPCYNEEASLPLLYDKLAELGNDARYTWEFLFINDGSKDGSLAVLKNLAENDTRVKFISLSRNFGKENAMLAGFDFATGDCMIIMDADLQHPPMLIPEMLRLWEEGYEDVYARRKDRETDSWMRRKLSEHYYRLLQKVSNVDILQNVGDFRLLDRKCINALKQLRETERYTKGMYCWIGFNKTELEYEVAERIAGKSSFSYRKLVKLAVNGFTSYTTAPLRISAYVGLAVSLLSFVLMLIFLIKALIYGDPVQGFPTLITVILFLGGVQLLSLGIIGEYLGKVFNETKHRPAYIISESNIQA
ncbi:MAG: glycosyltransferase family 2 protein [Bacteroidales bacterium]|jgi:glycosyltransferase involved in cell wall biosynthesis|nr:glycosyltransferase family 2 protein [Bacteroidales bacterium]